MKVSATSKVICGTVLASLSLVAIVVLQALHDDASPVIALLPVLGALIGLTGHIEGLNAAQNETLATISKNTNGVLDARIKDGVTSVLRDLGVQPVAPIIVNPPVPQPDPAPAVQAQPDDVQAPEARDPMSEGPTPLPNYVFDPRVSASTD